MSRSVPHFFVITLAVTLPQGILQSTRSGIVNVEVADNITAQFVYERCRTVAVEAAKETGLVAPNVKESQFSVLFWSLTRNDLNLATPVSASPLEGP
jgi:hypothetical protein